uniref:Uncharacterized protein n=1 Tax=Corvus moneduloides TaxID=1196302 RepID=A0A8U7NKB2_CORMO
MVQILLIQRQRGKDWIQAVLPLASLEAQGFPKGVPLGEEERHHLPLMQSKKEMFPPPLFSPTPLDTITFGLVGSSHHPTADACWSWVGSAKGPVHVSHGFFTVLGHLCSKSDKLP